MNKLILVTDNMNIKTIRISEIKQPKILTPEEILWEKVTKIEEELKSINKRLNELLEEKE